ncbi:hypothetical protein OHT52_18490 [Streptomyces sp. NBC_00247]|uniref:hypothetical protein n=1 Tax=Streptomyces sp. NBC_00247 TaxID=2975689 RepID=UPI002E2B7422|nr:hypothetical protein [Streptomyces sp. NBC_00247]
MNEMGEISASELLTSFAFDSEVAGLAKDALLSGAHLTVLPFSASAASIRVMCHMRLRIVRMRGGLTLGDAECLAGLADMGDQDVYLGFVDDRARTGWWFHLYLDPLRLTVAGCVAVGQIPRR